MKNKILIIALLVLLLPAGVQAVEDYPPLEEIPAEASGETLYKDDLIPDKSISEQIPAEPEVSEFQYKQPVSKRKIAKKFLAAMLGVAVSSFIIFFLLSIYNKLRSKFAGNIKTLDDASSLETPYDLDSAVKTFLDKTDWK